MWPDAEALDRFVAGVRRRLMLARAIEGSAAGCLVAAVLVMAGASAAIVLAFAFGIAAARIALGDEWRFGWWRSKVAIARHLERRVQTMKNLLVTAAEIADAPRSYVNDVVMKRAAHLTAGLATSELFPLRRITSALLVSILALAAVIVRPVDLPIARVRGVTAGSAPAINDVVVTVTPPAYSGFPQAVLTNPSRIEALANSRIDIRVESVGSALRMETLAGSQDLARTSGVFQGSVTATTDGFIALEPRDSAGVAGARYLVGLSVTADSPPRITLTSPGRDLFFSTVPGTLPVAISADDDIALANVELRYTAVSGSGERFTFVERTVPIDVTRANQRSWSARGVWNLAPLDLAPGDLVVYRAVARDRRPGATPVESESYVIEVVTPGAIAAEGFAADDQRDRYAVSQQMVILKTERLLARRRSMPSDSVADEARLLAAEQRQVRAEFVFMMGGELEDLSEESSGTLELNEVAEAEAEGDLLAGRLQNQGRVDMTRAIRAMSRASAALTNADLDQALRDERTALDNLMRAFARSRFILRALTQRERIDLERRLSGSLNLTAGLSGPVAAAAPDEHVAGLRRLLSELASLPTAQGAADSGLTNAVLALLRAGSASEALRDLASRAQGVARGPRPRSPAAVDSLLRRIQELIQQSLPLSPNVSSIPATDVLHGALRDASSRRGMRPTP